MRLASFTGIVSALRRRFLGGSRHRQAKDGATVERLLAAARVEWQNLLLLFVPLGKMLGLFARRRGAFMSRSLDW
jgi:hypothetical protein